MENRATESSTTPQHTNHTHMSQRRKGIAPGNACHKTVMSTEAVVNTAAVSLGCVIARLTASSDWLSGILLRQVYCTVGTQQNLLSVNGRQLSEVSI